MYEIDPAAKLGYTFTEGVQYKISFVHTSRSEWKENTHDLYFTTDCLGHVAYCTGETRPLEIDPSRSALVPHWDLEDLDGGFLHRYHRYLNAQGEMDIDPTRLDITGYAGNESDLEIPAAIDSLPVVKIADNAFEDNENLKSVKLPDSVTSIGAGAFSGCTGLTEINIPSSITTIKDHTFNYCTGLTSITIPASASCFGKCFAGCTSLKSVVFERDFSISNLPDHTFDGCGDITIYGYGNRYGACDIAKQFGFPYVDLDQCLPGDADASGVVDLMDATAIQRHLANLNVSVENAILMLGDIDSSGALEVSDATHIQRKITEIDVPNVIGLINSR